MTYTYIQHIPSRPLNAYIDDLYYWAGPTPCRRLKVIPIPALHLMVNFGQPFEIHVQDQAKPFTTCTDIWAVGLWSTYHVVNWPTNVEFFGVHFKPGGAYPFFAYPLFELHNQVVPLDAIWGNFAAEIRERLYAAPTIKAKLTLLEQLLLARLLDEPYGLNIVQYAISEIARNHGVLSIQELSDCIGISQNHLRTQFKRMVGIPPKELARLYRFAHIHRSLNATLDVDWAQIALQSGYYDQSHFNKDFIEFVGHRPTDHLRLLRQQHTDDPEHNYLLRPIPAN